MSTGHHAVDAVTESFHKLGGSPPTNKGELDSLITALPKLFEEGATGLDRLAESMPEAVHKDVADMIREIAGALRGVGPVAEDTIRTHHRVHGFWLNS